MLKLGARAPRPAPRRARPSSRASVDESPTCRPISGCRSSATPRSRTRAASTFRRSSIDPRTYEHVDPAASATSGASCQRAQRAQQRDRAARALGLELDPEVRCPRASRRRSRSSRARASASRTPRRRSSCSSAARSPATRGPSSRSPTPSTREGRRPGTSSDGVGGGRPSAARCFAARHRAAGPVDALEKAIRGALLPAFPGPRARLTPTSARRSREGRDGAPAPSASGSPRRRGTPAVDDGRQRHDLCTRPGSPWPTASSSRSRRAPASRRASRSSESRRRCRWPSSRRCCGRGRRRVAARIDEIDWTRRRSTSPTRIDREFAAHATALGAALFYSFGNFCAIAAHPDHHAVVRVNLLKGRPENQVGSVTTTATALTRSSTGRGCRRHRSRERCSRSWTTSTSSGRWASAGRPRRASRRISPRSTARSGRRS